ncbi:MAG: peptide chain release factor N(5)-glutamine methyltransferase [Buchnera aphidicola (Periphyllus acericola)]|uniref:peptide chain release factor N(5)-glutamine methyltransferase n=1 Tax=Buchnera aphidicola TaxID=9 RepID=UPI0030D0A9AE|nr:peptide chain release factor N(5)-glutamine methyltransferase [Buchnera aphidicola (Periphyllus acericola)]
MKIKEWKKKSLKILKNIKNSILDIEIFLSYILRKPRSWIICFENYILNDKKLYLLNKLVEKRFYFEPCSYLIQKKEFWSLNFYVTSKTIIPRPDSEILVERSLKLIKNSSLNILDLGTGCGNIAISIAFSKPKCHLTGIDYSYEIIKIALYNSINLKIKNINFFCSNWFSFIHKKKYDMIVSNPPYISFKDFIYLKKDIFFEPFFGLVSKKNGLSDIILIIKYSKNYLNNEGWLLIEHGWNQIKNVQKLFKKYKYNNIKTYKDYNGINRVTIGQNLNF